MNFKDDVAICACRQIKQILFILGRYPLFTSQYIRNNIDKPSTDPKELADYRSNSVDSKLCLAGLLMSLYIYNCVRNLYVVFWWLKCFNYSEHADNLKELSYNDAELAQMNYSLPRDTLTHVACLITNCTRLGPPDGQPNGHHERLLYDVRALPMIKMCNPAMDDYYYSPMTRLDAFGVLAFVVTMYTHFLLGTWPTIQQMLMPAHDDMIMFISSPRATQRVVLARCRELLQDVTRSYHNFCLFLISATSKYRATRTSLPASLIDHPTDGCWNEGFRQKVELDKGHANEEYGMKLEARVEDEQIEAPVFKCLPVIYTQWWRTRVAQILVNTLCFSAFYLAAAGLAAFLFVQYRLNLRAQLLETFDQQMHQVNCFIWRDTIQSLDSDHAVHLTEVRFDWTILSIFNGCLISFVAGVAILSMFSVLWAELLTINLWVAEVRMFLVASLLATRQQHLYELCGTVRENEPDADEYFHEASREVGEPMIDMRRFFDMAPLRKHFEKSVKILIWFLYQRVPALGDGTRHGRWITLSMLNSKDIDRDHESSFRAEVSTLDTIKNPSLWQTSYGIETLEQIYVNFRLLVEYIQGLRKVMSLIILVCYLLNYGYILLAIICWRKIATSNLDTNVIVLFAFTVSSILIFLCASFHSSAKQLQPLLYSLIARLALSRNLRVQHVRSLFTRQTLMLDDEGGLALSAYGLKITYVNIIQLVIGTATVVVLALKQNV